MPDVTSPYTPGTPCWVDLMVPDQQAALDFYRDLFGWQGEAGGAETGGYAVCTLNGKPVAGIMKAMNPDGSTPDPAPPTAWTTYLATTDLSAAERAITANGGQVIMPGMDVLTLGQMAVATDPTGAAFGLWQARDFHGAGIVNEPGAVIWNEINTTDPAAAAPFYAKVLGVKAAPMEAAPDYFALSVDGRTVGGMQGFANKEEPRPAGPSHWLTYFSVDDTDSTVDALVRAGGNVLKPPFDMMAGRMALVQDPQGGVFGVINTTGPEAA
ncbi:VOC family protein [Streptomyces sp. NBC_01020]|uniref:VOC family protein n=1 Tax=unclassified Streptomyces TaxID=2593676 RepID=UPI002E1C5D62|nr:VOC family protein [Streptomyces sp. NBC_01020]WSX71309.1 VOC family protein [Streptomyces sp. NBC_00932]